MSVYVLAVVFLKTVNPEDDSKNFADDYVPIIIVTRLLCAVF